MKKHLIALAVAGAVAAPAFAQNVTIYGTIAGGYQSTETTTATTSAVDNQDSLNSTLWGLRGTEDLGGGMKAFFNLENEFTTGSGVSGNSSVSTASEIWTKTQIGISLANGTSISWGKQGSVYDSYKSWGNMGANFFSTTDQYLDDMGDIHDSTLKVENIPVGPVKLSASTSQRAAFQDVNSFAVTGEIAGATVGFAAAQSNLGETESTVNVEYPVLSNLTARVQYMKGKEPNATTARNNQKAMKLGVKYTMGAIDILGSIQSYKDSVGAAAEEDALGVMGVYNLSKRTALFAGYNNRSVNNADTTTMVVGAQHKF
jgi:predicted porin